MKPAVSLIVPIYCVEKFIERCAISLFEQSFESIEYVFVDNATPDNSIEILKKTAVKYPNRKIKIIIHSENKGPAAARQTAIENSSGKYILMCDSDDYIEKNTVQLLYEKIIREDADIAVCDIMFEFPNHSKICYDNVVQTDNPARDKEENFSNMLTQTGTINSLCNKMVKRSLFEKFEIKALNNLNYYSEDRYITLRLYYFSDKITKVDKALYHYIRYNTNSITKNIKEYHFKDTILLYETLKDFLNQKGMFEKYILQITKLKLERKLILFWGVSDTSLRYKYSTMFDSDLANKKFATPKNLSDRLMLYFSRHKSTLWLTSLLKKLVETKQKLKKIVTLSK